MIENPSSPTNIPKSRFPRTAGFVIVALVVGIGGTWFAMSLCGGQGGASSMAGCGMSDASGCGMGRTPVAAGQGQGKVLFYRNPMNPSITSPVPKKDGMGMDYVPVFAGAGR